MRVLINDKPIEALTPKHEGGVMLARDVKATVLTPAQATEAYIVHTKRWFMILGGIALVLMLASPLPAWSAIRWTAAWSPSAR
jgi:hypothetical protein